MVETLWDLLQRIDSHLQMKRRNVFMKAGRCLRTLERDLVQCMVYDLYSIVYSIAVFFVVVLLLVTSSERPITTSAWSTCSAPRSSHLRNTVARLLNSEVCREVATLVNSIESCDARQQRYP